MKHNIAKIIVRSIGVVSMVAGMYIYVLGSATAFGGLSINGKKY